MTVSSYLKYNDPIRIIWRAGTVEDPYVAKSESWKIINNKIFLSEVPDSVNRVIIDGYIEVNDINQTLLSNQFRVNYQNAMIEFNQSEEGKSINTSYQGKGIILYPAERIYVHNDNPDIVLTLQDIADNNQDTINLQAELIQIRDDANTAVNNANTTNDAITLAESDRVNAENVRESNESTRQNNESTRESNELARINSENNRLNSETVRENNESQRISNETIRQSNETTRQNNTTTAINNAETATANANNAANLAQNLVNTSIHLSDYNAATQYVINNEVSYQGSTYRCILDSFGNAPTDTIYWVLVAAKGLDGTGTGDMSKSTYDTNNDGIVDLADDTNKFGGKLPSEYSSSSHTHSELHSHTNKVELDRIGIDINNNLTIDDIPYESGASIDDVSISPNTTWSSENISNKIGILTNLQTTEKTNLVGAINEINTELNSPEYSSLLTQDKDIFTTGTSKDGTDVSASVVDGALSDIKLKGMTRTNLLGTDGDFENTNNNVASTAIVTIDTTKKVFGTSSMKIETTSIGGYGGKYANNLKGLGKYLLVSGYVANTGSASQGIALRFLGIGDVSLYSSWNTATEFKRVAIKIQPTDYDNATEIRIVGIISDSSVIGKIGHIDGFMVNEITADEYNNLTVDQLMQKYPYVTGTKSTVSVVVDSETRNRFDKSKASLGKSLDNNTGNLVSDSTRFTSDFIKVKAGTTVTINNPIRAVLFNANKTYLQGFVYGGVGVKTISITNDGYIKFEGMLTEIETTQLVNGTTLPTTYEPYKLSQALYTLPNGEENRRLPNGIYDEVDGSGKRTKRIQSVLNVASGTVINYADMKTGGQFVAYYSDGTQQVGVKGDTLTNTATSLIYQLANEEKSQLDGVTIPVGFKGGTITIRPQDDSAEFVAPEFEYKVVLNRAAQIDGNTRMSRQNAEEIIRIYARMDVAGI